jgi:hypothetical protein
MFECVKNLVGNINIDLFVVDMEQAVILAFSEVFDGKFIRLCLFHLHQAFWRKIQENKFTNMYKSDADFKLSCKMNLSLLFVPPENVLFEF